MTCADIERQIRPFLDDLLSEEEYQSAHAHIEGCSKCQRYVGALGSFSYLLKELGEIEAPRDLADSILFNLKKTPVQADAPRSKTGLIVGAIIIILIGGAMYWGFRHFKTKQRPSQPAAPIVVPANLVQEEESESPKKEAILLEQVQVFGSEEADQETPDERAGPSQMTPQKVSAFHWHLPHSQDETQKMLAILNRIGASYEYKLPELVILTLTAPEFSQFVRETEAVAPRMLPVRNAPLEPNQKINLTMYLEETAKTSNTLHWHVRVPPENESKLFEIFRRMEISLDHDSSGLVVLKVSSTKVEELIEKMKAIEGLSGNFTSPNLSSTSLSSYPVRIIISFSEA